MNRGVGEDALVPEAREMLAAGQGAEEAFAELAARTGEWHVSALAVCLAAGVPRPEAESRLRACEALFAEFGAGEEKHAATLLASGYVFLVDRVLDEREEYIRDLLATAAGARWGWPGSLTGWFRTGELEKIFVFFARTDFRGRRGSPPDFWAAMAAAGELLAAGDGSDRAAVTAALVRCHEQRDALRML
ncbi:hypothetical protein [Streptomyces liangshanensis]|uniref:hypothetical protein n=1 Tax=Streptomyces liangshanensis TaxID=2717324 RepID=UPI0036DF4955